MNWFQIAYCGITFIAVTCFHYVQELFQITWTKKWNIVNYLLGILFSFLILKTNLVIKGLYKFFWGPYPKAGVLHPLFLLFFISTLTFALALLIYEIRFSKNDLKKKNQAKYVFTAFFIFSFACIDFIPNYGIEIYPFGYILTTIFILIITYAIVKHQLMDIRIVFRTGLVYSLLVTVITIVYLILVLSIEKIFHDLLGYHSFFTSVLAAVLIAIFFIPLKNRIQYLLDKYFFKGTHAQIAEQNELLRKELAQSEKMKADATLASGMAHEIKNPITAIKAFTDFLPQKKNDPAFLENFQKVVGTEVDRIDQLACQLLDFAKPAPLKLQPTDIHQLLDDTLDLLNNQLSKNKIKLIRDYEASCMTLNLDPNQFKQALLNIFMNAIDAMPDGGALTIHTSLGLISKRLSFPNALVGNLDDPKIRPPTKTFGGDNSGIDSKSFILIIQDTGHGIHAKDLPRIFDPFFSKKSNGTGLGLSITQGIVQEHNGKIKVKSTIGMGTQFIIELLNYPKDHQ